MDTQNKPIFKKNILKIGNSYAITIPPELINYLELEEKDEIGIVADYSKWGKFIGIWNEKQQKQTKLQKG